MRKNFPVTQREIKMKPGTRLITTTNLKGVITYCNDDFVEISGYTYDELIGQAHNLIRHPDMPQAAFQSMWDYIKAGKAWMGVVKNRAKNGDHYWVSAYVTPIIEAGDVTGYESVRVPPTEQQISRAEALYKRLNAGKSPISIGRRIANLSVQTWPFVISLVLSLIALKALGPTALGYGLVVLASIIGAGGTLALVNGRLNRLLALRPEGFKDPIIGLTYSDDPGLFSQVAMLLMSEKARIRTALTRIDDRAEQLYEQTLTTNRFITEGSDAIARQRNETDQTASAMNEMTASIHDVAQTVSNNAKVADDANDMAASGSSRSREALTAIEQLVSRVNAVGEAIEKLGESTQSIGEATELISDIAEQTNLLALNAAIEAARAGEQGRGFAVVADEVRSLAQRTRESTVRIESVIEDFRTQVKTAVEMTELGEQDASKGLERVKDAEGTLQEIVGAINEISQSFINMSAAFEEQSQVAEEINSQVVNIASLADDSTNKAQDAKQSSDKLSELSFGLKDLVSRFVSKDTK